MTDLTQLRDTLQSECDQAYLSMAPKRDLVSYIGQLECCDAALASFKDLDWKALRSENPQQAGDAFENFTQLTARREQLVARVQSALTGKVA